VAICGLKCHMTQLERIAETHRVATRRDACGDPIIPGKNGHLYTDDGAVMVCFTDDGRKPFASKLFKTKRLQTLNPHVVRIKCDLDFEFMAEIADTAESIRAALQVLGVKRFKQTKGVHRDLPAGLVEYQRKRKAAGTAGNSGDC
jgi:hypothetical protein